MLGKRWRIYLLIIAIFVILIKWYTINSLRVENSYSTFIYPKIGMFFRLITAWLPISFGDILYGLAVGWLLYSFILFIIAALKHNLKRQKIVYGLKRTILISGIIYIVFNLLWGINYNRLGIAYQLKLNMQPYSVEDLKNINEVLLSKVNTAKLALLNNPQPYPTNKELFAKVKNAYNRLSNVYPFLAYKTISLKSSMWGWLGNYTGFTGYYNPFTGEGQVNTSIPKFLLPYTTCHEVAHQLGYAKEMEANFVGYLAASNSADTLFYYSVYLDLFIYSNRNLRSMDSVVAKKYAEQLIPAVKTDLEEWRKFSIRYKNPIEPFIRWGYGKYLQSNSQPQGMMSYDEVTSFLIAYYKKFGKI
jgi:hypothetical protein